MKKLDLSKQEKEVVDQALQHWYEQKLLDADKVQELQENMDERSFEWKVLARYAFWVALASLIFSVVSLFADDMLVRFVEQFYETPNIVFCLFFAGLAVAFYMLGFRNKKRYPDKTFSNETLMLSGAFSTAASIGFLGQILDHSTNVVFTFGPMEQKVASSPIFLEKGDNLQVSTDFGDNVTFSGKGAENARVLHEALRAYREAYNKKAEEIGGKTLPPSEVFEVYYGLGKIKPRVSYGRRHHGDSLFGPQPVGRASFGIVQSQDISITLIYVIIFTFDGSSGITSIWYSVCD